MQLDQFVEALKQDSARRIALAGHLGRIEKELGEAKRLLTPENGELPSMTRRPGYIKLVLEAIKKAGRPIRVAEMRDYIVKLPGMEGIKRVAVERTVFMEMRKENPRIRRVGQGLYTTTERKGR